MSDLGPVVRFEPVAEEVVGDRSVLSVAELDRYRRLRSPAGRAAYAAAHRLVRECVADLVGLPPRAARELVIAQHCDDCGAAGHGAPYVVGLADRVQVSLSHTDGWVAAIAAVARCGVDVQAVRPVPDRALTADERDWAGADPLLRSRLWSRKEALAKAGLADIDAFWGFDARDPDPRLREWQADGVVGAWIVAEA